MHVHNIGTFACYGQKILILVHLFEFLSIFCTKFYDSFFHSLSKDIADAVKSQANLKDWD